MITDTRALRSMPAALKPRMRRMDSGWWRLTVPNWSTLRGENAYYVSLYPDSVLAHWARDVTRWHDEDLPTLLYRARREYRSLQETLGSIGTL
jgi:hypothetical protein